MPIQVQQVVTDHGPIREPHYETSQFLPDQLLPVVITEAQRHGVWKVTNRATAGTTIITSPAGEGAIILTDIIVSTDKVANSSAKLQFADGAVTEIIALFDSANAPVALAIGFVGQILGWKDARLELVTVSTVNATIMSGYIKIPDGLPFSEWDALR